MEDTKKDEAQLNLLPAKRIPNVYDNMNLVEHPFALLTHSNKRFKETKLYLNEAKTRYVECTDTKYGFPTALADRVVLGLIAMTKHKNGFTDPRIVFSLRELVERYMFPKRFNNYRANGAMLKKTEQQLYSLRRTAIVSDIWYDMSLGTTVEAQDAAFFDKVNVVERGGKNALRILSVIWGTDLFESFRAGYFRTLDTSVYQSIDHPFDERLYRWLDRQLDTKKEQRIRCQTLGKYKLAMTGDTVDAGGREASRHITGKIKKALTRLEGIGFPIELTVDRTSPDFLYRFSKKSSGTNTLSFRNEVGELLQTYLELFHGIKRKRRNHDDNDIEIASQWIDEYGLEKSLWIVRQSWELHHQSKRKDEKIRSFRGVHAIYRDSAEGDFDALNKDEIPDGQIPLDFEIPPWDQYRCSMLAFADDTLSDAEVLEIQKTSEEECSKLLGSILTKNDGEDSVIRESTFLGEVQNKKLQSVKCLTREEYEAFTRADDLSSFLLARHGFDPFS